MPGMVERKIEGDSCSSERVELGLSIDESRAKRWVSRSLDLAVGSS